MSLLQYSSKEMFSATDLVRKNKYIFDKLNSKEIEKAVILKDGKPSFIMMDFEFYENIIAEFQKLKTKKSIQKENNSKNNEEISEEDYNKALDEIKKLDVEKIIKEETKDKRLDELKEFWG